MRNGKIKMYWSTMPFGKYGGQTLPEIIIRDPDWFFYMLPNLYGRLGEEAQNLARKARAIKIPKSRPRNWTIEYRYDCDQGFCGLALVRADRAIRDGRQDFHILTWHCLSVARPMTSEPVVS
jgi:hypothetical protein